MNTPITKENRNKREKEEEKRHQKNNKQKIKDVKPNITKGNTYTNVLRLMKQENDIIQIWLQIQSIKKLSKGAYQYIQGRQTMRRIKHSERE